MSPVHVVRKGGEHMRGCVAGRSSRSPMRTSPVPPLPGDWELPGPTITTARPQEVSRSAGRVLVLVGRREGGGAGSRDTHTHTSWCGMLHIKIKRLFSLANNQTFLLMTYENQINFRTYEKSTSGFTRLGILLFLVQNVWGGKERLLCASVHVRITFTQSTACWVSHRGDKCSFNHSESEGRLSESEGIWCQWMRMSDIIT